MTLFKLDAFSSITYTAGAHSVTVTPNKGKTLKALNNKEIKSFHIKHIDHEFCLKKKNIAQKRRGSDDIKHGYGRHYMINDVEFNKKWEAAKKNLIKVDEYLNGKVRGKDAVKQFKIFGKTSNVSALNKLYPIN